MISIDDFLLFCNRTLDGYEGAIAELDDETVNALPPLPDPNSPFQLVTHAVGAGTWWTARVVCGHEVERDRDGEFSTVGTADAARKSLADFRRLLGDRESRTLFLHLALDADPDERERERRSKNRRAQQLSAARSFETVRSWNFINILQKIRHF